MRPDFGTRPRKLPSDFGTGSKWHQPLNHLRAQLNKLIRIAKDYLPATHRQVIFLFEVNLPKLKPDDPEFVYVNAAFYALAHPPSRRMLELLATGPRTRGDFIAHIALTNAALQQALDALVLVGFVKAEGTGGQACYMLEGPAVDRVKSWVSLLPSSQD
jgi:hypothetical protein